MAQNINDNLRLHAPKLLDDRAGPYASVAAALAGIPAYQRVEGLEVVIEVGGVQKKYWFDGGVADEDLVEIPGGGSGGYEPKNSIEVDSDELQLVGDEDDPGNSKYYGTDETGEKGFHTLPAGGGGLPRYGTLINFDTYDDLSVKRTKTEYPESKFIETRIAYHDSGDEIGQPEFMEVKDDLSSEWYKITFNYTDGKLNVTNATTLTVIAAWTITV